MIRAEAGLAAVGAAGSGVAYPLSPDGRPRPGRRPFSKYQGKGSDDRFWIVKS